MNIEAPAKVDLSKYIEVRLFGDRPHVRGRRIPVAIVILRARLNNFTIADTAYDFSISEAEVLAAMLYYEEHKTLIDTQIADDEAQFEEMKRLHGKS